MTSLRGSGERNFNAVSHKPTRAPIQSVFESWRPVGCHAGRFATKKSFQGRKIFILNKTDSERSKSYVLGCPL